MARNLLKRVKDYLGKKELDPKNKKTILFSIYVLLIFTVIYHLVYAHKIIPGVKVGSTFVGGKTYSEAKLILEEQEQEVTKVLPIKVEDHNFNIDGEKINLIYDWDGSVSRAFEVGRTGNIFRDTKDKLAGLLRSLYIGAFYDYDDDALSTQLSIMKGEVNIEAVQAGVVLEEEELLVTESSEGKKVEDDTLYKIVINSFDKVDFSEKKVPTKIIKPKIKKEDVESKLDEVQKIVFNTIQISQNGNVWLLETEQLIDLLAFKKDGKKVELGLNEPKFEAFVDSISSTVNELPRGKVTSTDGDRVTGFELIQDGKELDVKQFTEDFKIAFFDAHETVSLPMVVVTGPTDKEKYGIYALLGEGVSHFKGSVYSRIHNLTLAAERTNGVLVAPGAIYSLNNSIGDISTATGYHTAYIIKGDRTVLGSGGGVCQTSTTLFRAVLNSGLPIVMRYPHAYRVTYYEQDMPVGFDAAIFQPSWDLRFKNDTDAYVLVQTQYLPDEYALSFKLYGTPDGRTVEISEPEITNQTPPPPALYQDDPELPKGTVKQIDFAAWGAKSKFTRTVYKNDEVLFEDTYSSTYTPWKAIYLVGTKE